MVHIRVACNNRHFYQSRPVCIRQRLPTGDGPGLIVYGVNARRRLRYGGRLGRGGRLVRSDGRRAHDVGSPVGVDDPVDFNEYHADPFRNERQKNHTLTGVAVVQKYSFLIIAVHSAHLFNHQIEAFRPIANMTQAMYGTRRLPAV